MAEGTENLENQPYCGHVRIRSSISSNVVKLKERKRRKGEQKHPRQFPDNICQARLELDPAAGF